MKSGLEGTYVTAHRTKRQQEVLERLHSGAPVKKIARDLGVSRNAVYQTIDRLRLQGALPADFTASGQLPRGRVELLSGPPTSSRLAELRELEDEAASSDRYAELVEAAIADGDVAALAYELGRLDAGGRGEVPAKLIEAALRRRGAIASEQPAASDRADAPTAPESG
ncbi:MAG TPA: helix-turn-helix domain-containing protein [Solirubrobacterales bacterium]|nr:helix-turn-helix domain-containing protein [Solirubrobacterales bacterium]